MRTFRKSRGIAVAMAVAVAAIGMPRPAAAAGIVVASAADGGLSTFVGPVGRGLILSDARSPVTVPEPRDLAMPPDGRTVDVVSGDALTILDAGTFDVGTRTAVGAGPGSHLAVSPDGSLALITTPSANALTPVDTTTGTAGAPVALPHPVDVAITPNGATAYVVTASSTLTPVDLATRAAGTPIALSHPGVAISITPDGKLALVAEAEGQGTSAPGPSTMQVIELEDGQPEPPVALDAVGATAMTLTADGKTAYVGDTGTNLLPFDVASRTTGNPIVNRTPAAGVDQSSSDLAASADGLHVFGTVPCLDRRCTGGVSQVDADAGGGHKAGEFDVGDARPSSLVLAPSPQATFGAGSQHDLTQAFSGVYSSNDGGKVTAYSWQFGDGTPVVTTDGADVGHQFPAYGTYTVTLTTTNSGGCADHVAYTGQSTACSGRTTATTTRSVTLEAPAQALTPTTQTPTPTVTLATGTLALRATTLHLKGTRARVALHCSGTKSCRGRLTLSIRDTHRARHTVVCGRVTLALKAGTTAHAELPVGAPCRSRLRHAARGRLAATLRSSLTSRQKNLARAVQLRRT